jgi:glycosyltransferase involved in cell wall biosynthesis
VLIPVWNDQAGLDKTLETLANDSLPFDIVVVDDGSATAIVCDELNGSHETTLRRLRQNRGVEHALNDGLMLILGREYRYVARLDCGDQPLPRRLERQRAFLDDHAAVGIVGTWAQCVDDDGAYLFTLRFPADHPAMLKRQRYVPAMLHPTVMIRA